MAREAARLLEGSNWLPEPLRNPDDASAASTPSRTSLTDGDGSAAELPAFLADEADAVEPVVEAAE